MLHFGYWKHNNLNCVVQTNTNALKTGRYHRKVNTTPKGPHLSNSANRNKCYKWKATVPFALLPPVSSYNPNTFLQEARTEFYRVSVRRDNSPQSHGQILTTLMFPLLLGSSPPLNWIKCNMNCTLRCDNKAIPRIPHRFQSE